MQIRNRALWGETPIPRCGLATSWDSEIHPDSSLTNPLPPPACPSILPTRRSWSGRCSRHGAVGTVAAPAPGRGRAGAAVRGGIGKGVNEECVFAKRTHPGQSIVAGRTNRPPRLAESFGQHGSPLGRRATRRFHCRADYFRGGGLPAGHRARMLPRRFNA